MPADPPFEQYVGYLLKRAQHALRTEMDRSLNFHGLTTPQYVVLAALESYPGISSAELARRSFVTPQTMFRIVAGLTKRGLVRRKELPRHGRELPADLTPEGLSKVRACHRRATKVERRMLAPLSRVQRRTFARLLQDCAEALSERH
ncbi:MAG TPA: MarR family transcriptional regulator [Thermoplasmata archaeon]|nr:MarR family transcriptional regulator [Thermoplasmata archaeon]